ncbi:hypothetical protein C4587_00560 [Candidatus Parcubacteria bacterium]|nr:MAG: hypothetical protein C4587_00560 [Candidatus Parcubacteria bacterium]
MAIVVEQERRKSHLGATITWFSLIVVFGLVAYYVFFTRPDFAELIPPAGFRDTTQLSEIKLNPEEVVTNPDFQILRQYIAPLEPQDVGRANPFLGF